MLKNRIYKMLWMMPCLMLGLASPIFTACEDDEIEGSVIEMPESEMWDTTAIGRYIYSGYLSLGEWPSGYG